MHDTWGLKAGLPTERPLSCFSRVKYGERASVVASLSLNHATRPQTIAVMSKYGIAVAIARRNLCSRNTHRGGGHLGGSAYLPLSTTDEHRECVRF